MFVIVLDVSFFNLSGPVFTVVVVVGAFCMVAPYVVLDLGCAHLVKCWVVDTRFVGRSLGDADVVLFMRCFRMWNRKGEDTMTRGIYTRLSNYTPVTRRFTISQ